MKQSTKILLLFILTFSFYSCYSKDFLNDKNFMIEKSISEKINGKLDTISIYNHKDVYLIVVDSCSDTINFFREYEVQNNKSLLFVFPLISGFPFSKNNNNCVSDFDYSKIMEIQHFLFPCSSNYEIERSSPSSDRLLSFTIFLSKYLQDIHQTEQIKKLIVRLTINEYNSILPKEYQKKNNKQEDEKEKQSKRKYKNFKELGDLFKAISLIVGIIIAFYHRRNKKD